MTCSTRSFLAIAVLLLSQAAQPAEILSETRSAIQQWVETEQLISRETRQWQEEKTYINNILTILSAERRELNGQIALAQEIATRADEERAALVEQLSGYQATSELLESRIADFERQLLLIANYLPEVLKEELAPRFSRLNAVAGVSAYSLGERAQAVLNLMSEIQNFDSKLTLTTEIISNDRGDRIEVKVLYLGLSRAFFINDNVTTGGYGVPTESGWQWQQANELGERIAGAFAAYEARVSPRLVDLPMQVLP